jgi:hypothetical protein
MKSILPGLLLLPLLWSCGPPDIRIKRAVTAGELVGTWRLDPGSSALAADGDGDDYRPDPGKPHEIVFRADGTCRYRSVLQMPTRYVDAEGEWKISATSDDPKGCEVEVELGNVSGATYLFSLDLREDSGCLVLWEFWSDPDLWNFLDYRKAAP